jgi:hypothetical protein
MHRFLMDYRGRVAREGRAALAADARAFIECVRKHGMLNDLLTELPSAAAVLALAEAHPDAAPRWRAEEAAMFQQATRIMERAPEDRPGRNDALYARWRILGLLEDAQALRKASKRNDPRGETCRWMLERVLADDVELADVLCAFASEEAAGGPPPRAPRPS